MRPYSQRWSLLLVGLVAITVWTMAPSEAFAEKGALYVTAHIGPKSAKLKEGVQHAFVYIYTEEGRQVSSGKGQGGWLPGDAIPLEAGNYWLNIGTEQTQADLRNYTVVAGKTTVVPTGWVSVATIPMAEQPSVDCSQWTASLRVYAQTDSGPKLVATNSNRKPDAYGGVQVHAGEYLVEFNRLSAVVAVENGKDYRLPTGYVGPSYKAEAYLLRNKGDDPRSQGLPVCTDNAMHVTAGDYFLRELETRDDGATIEFVVNPYSVEKEGNFGYTTLKADGPGKKARTPGSDEGQRITAAQIKALTGWGQKSGGFDDLQMFGD